MIPNPKGGRRFASASSEAAPKNSDAREKIYCNAQMSSRPIRTFPRALHRLRALSRTRITEQGLTPAPTTDILKVARTVADIEETAIIEPKHIAEAIEYRAWT